MRKQNQQKPRSSSKESITFSTSKKFMMLVWMVMAAIQFSFAGAGNGASSQQNFSCLQESFNSNSFPYSGWLATGTFRSTNAADVNSAPAAAIIVTPNGYMTLPSVSYPTSMTVNIGRGFALFQKTLNIQVSTTSQTSGFTTVASYNNNTIAQNSYNQYTIDLSAYNGNSNVWIRFQKSSVISIAPWRIDDIGVTCTPCPLPVITSSPSPVSLCAGLSATFDAQATGAGPLTYQWQQSTDGGATWTDLADGGNVSGSGTSSLTINPVNNSENGYQYHCNVTNACGGPVASAPATLTVLDVLAAPAVINGLNYVCPPQSGVVYSIAPVPGATDYTWYFAPGTIGATFVGPTNGTSVVVDFTSSPYSAYKIRVTANNSCGSSLPAGLLIRREISVPPLTGPTSVCAGNTGTYTIPTAVNGAVSYTWTAPAGATINGNPSPYNTTSLSVNITMPAGFTGGDVCVAAVDPCGNPTVNRCISVVTIPTKPNKVLGTNFVCPGTNGLTFSIDTVPNATSYNWTVPAGVTITSGQGTTAIVVSIGSNFTNGSICVTADNACGSGPQACIQLVSTLAGVPSIINGQTSGVCGGGTYTYSTPLVANATSYNWTVPAGASIVSGNGTDSVVVDFTGATLPGDICVTASNSCGTSNPRCTTIRSLPRRPDPVSGPAVVCVNSTGVSYSVPAVPGATSYNWTVPVGASVATGQGTNSITVDWGSTGGNVNVVAINSCGQSLARTYAVSVVPQTGNPGPITGPDFVCPPQAGVTYSIAPVPGATSYLWYVDSTTIGATIVGPDNGTSVVVDFGATPYSAYRLRVVAISPCGTSQYSGLLVRRQLSTPQLTGPAFVCAGNSGTFTATVVGPVVDYTWTAPSGATIDGNASPYTTTNSTVTVAFPSGYTGGQVCVTATDPCGNLTGQRCIDVPTIPTAPSNIAGSSLVCPGATGLAYSIQAIASATSYNWTATGGIVIASGQGTNQITIDVPASFTTGSVCVTGQNTCGTGSQQCRNLSTSVPATPGTINGPKAGVCGGTFSYSVSNVANATSYTWSVPAGATILSGNGTNTISVDFTGATLPGQVCVTADNSCGSSSSRCATVKGSPSDPTGVNGPATVCANQTGVQFYVDAVAGATSYLWTVPSGATITSGAGTDTITVDFGANGGNVTVKAVNACGQSGSKVLAVTVNCRIQGVEQLVSVYPNPSNGLIHIDINSTQNDRYELQVSDVSGRIYQVNNYVINQGLNTVELDLTGLSSGVYSVQLKSGSGIITQKMITIN